MSTICPDMQCIIYWIENASVSDALMNVVPILPPTFIRLEYEKIINLKKYQCRDFPQSYVVIPLVITTSNLFYNFFITWIPTPSLKLIILWYNSLFSFFCYSI